jgi:hypothetical protein
VECERSVIEVKAHRPVVPSCITFAQVPILSHRKDAGVWAKSRDRCIRARLAVSSVQGIRRPNTRDGNRLFGSPLTVLATG